jgi:hypothetical protein
VELIAYILLAPLAVVATSCLLWAFITALDWAMTAEEQTLWR